VEGSDEGTALSQGFERTVVEMCGLRTMSPGVELLTGLPYKVFLLRHEFNEAF